MDNKEKWIRLLANKSISISSMQLVDVRSSIAVQFQWKGKVMQKKSRGGFLRKSLSMLSLGLVAVVPAALLWWLLPRLPLVLTAAAVVGTFAGVYLLLAWRSGLPQLRGLTGRFLRRG